MVENKKFLLLLAMFAVVIVSASFASAIGDHGNSSELNVSYFADFNNYTSTINFYCNTSLNTTDADGINGVTDYNVSLYYNASGGSAGSSDGSLPNLITARATRLTTITNTSAYQGAFISNDISISGLSGLFSYNFSCLADNGTDSEWTTGYANITIINTSLELNVTNILIINSSADEHNNYGNFSGNFTVNATVNLTIPTIGDDDAITALRADEFGYLDSVYFNFSKSGEEMFFESSHGGDTLPFTTFAGYNQSIDSLNGSFSDASQVYSLCIFANTSLSNINRSECHDALTIDNNAPSPSLTRNAASSTTDTIVLTIAPGESGAGLNGDCSTDRGTLSALSVTAPNLNCGEAYSFKVSCTDYMNLVGSTTTSFSTDDCSGGTGAGGTGGAVVTGKTYSVTETQLNEGVTKQVAANDQVKFTIGTSTHSIKATSVTTDKATITISSSPQTATLSIGDIRNFDLDADGIYDVQVKLNSITSGKADLSVKKTDLKVTEETEAAEKAKEEAAGVGQEEIPEEKAPAKLTWLWIVLAVVVIAVIIYFITKKKK